MKKEKWDGKSRPSNDTYKKNFNEIFGKKPEMDLKGTIDLRMVLLKSMILIYL